VTPEQLRREANEVVWFHTMDLGHGVITRGYDATPGRLARMALPERMSGKTVLDIGTWDGFFAFEAERRGAADVLAIDSFAWHAEGWSGRRGFDLAHSAYSSRVRSAEIDIMDISPETVGGSFDIVLFLGTLYHLRHPLLALERVSRVVADLLIVETEADNLLVPWPSLAFYPDRELNDDPTNWFSPNVSGAIGLLRAAGFPHVTLVSHSPWPRRLVRAAKVALTTKQRFLRNFGRDRITLHARKGAARNESDRRL
jgi:tRNA (mo5U34)-methyltransferase